MPEQPEIEGTTEVRILWAVRWPDGTLMGPMYSDDGSDYAEQVIRSTADGVGGETVMRTETITRTPWELAPACRPADEIAQQPTCEDHGRCCTYRLCAHPKCCGYAVLPERQSPVPDATKSGGMVQRYRPGLEGNQ